MTTDTKSSKERIGPQIKADVPTPFGISVIHETEKPVIDIVAIHGIGAHPKNTWTTGGINWLEDSEMLPGDVPKTRIMQFAYESRWLGKVAVNQRLSLVAEQLLQCLKGMRKGRDSRPLIFVAHCFGGLVVQKALISARLRQETYGSCLHSTAGIVFLGTPHRGSQARRMVNFTTRLTHLLPIQSIQAEPGIYDILRHNSRALKDLLYDFTLLAHSSSIPIVCFYELYCTNVALITKPQSRQWRWLPWPRWKELVVDELSACIDGYPKLALAADHFYMNKFSSPTDNNYILVRDTIVDMVERARVRDGARSDGD